MKKLSAPAAYDRKTADASVHHRPGSQDRTSCSCVLQASLDKINTAPMTCHHPWMALSIDSMCFVSSAHAILATGV